MISLLPQTLLKAQKFFMKNTLNLFLYIFTTYAYVKWPVHIISSLKLNIKRNSKLQLCDWENQMLKRNKQLLKNINTEIKLEMFKHVLCELFLKFFYYTAAWKLLTYFIKELFKNIRYFVTLVYDDDNIIIIKQSLAIYSD